MNSEVIKSIQGCVTLRYQTLLYTVGPMQEKAFFVLFSHDHILTFNLKVFLDSFLIFSRSQHNTLEYMS